MSMPHGTTSNEQNERWITDARKQMIPDKVDWTVAAINGAHIWLETDASGCFSSDCKVFIYTILLIFNIMIKESDIGEKGIGRL